jgi:hypothetical protein
LWECCSVGEYILAGIFLSVTTCRTVKALWFRLYHVMYQWRLQHITDRFTCVLIDQFHPFYRPRRPLGRVEGSASRPGRFLPPGKTRYPLCRRLGGPQGRSGLVRKMSSPPGFDPRTVFSVAQSLYRLSYPAHRFFL